MSIDATNDDDDDDEEEEGGGNGRPRNLWHYNTELNYCTSYQMLSEIRIRGWASSRQIL